MVLSTALFNKPAFKNLVCNGLVLADDGKKMSKRLKNYPVSSSINPPPPLCFLEVSMCDSRPAHPQSTMDMSGSTIAFQQLHTTHLLQVRLSRLSGP